MTTYDPTLPWVRSYAEGVPADLDPVSGCLTDIVTASARDDPDAPALEFVGRTTSYRGLQEQIDRVAAALRERGVGPGDTVAIVLPNCPSTSSRSMRSCASARSSGARSCAPCKSSPPTWRCAPSSRST